jgi:hypothetical protein
MGLVDVTDVVGLKAEAEAEVQAEAATQRKPPKKAA